MTSYELRRYVTKPGRRDDLIALFERDFIESQEACGMVPLGHYRDHAHPDTFVWLRGFPNFAARKPALDKFYVQSPVWKKHRDAANDTMVDSDDVLLLRPVFPDSGIDVRGLTRAANGEASKSETAVVAAIFSLAEPIATDAIDAIARSVVPVLRSYLRRVAVLATDERPNDFPALPVRDGSWLVFTASASLGAQADYIERTLATAELPTALQRIVRNAEFLRLEPAARSLYR